MTKFWHVAENNNDEQLTVNYQASILRDGWKDTETAVLCFGEDSVPAQGVFITPRGKAFYIHGNDVRYISDSSDNLLNLTVDELKSMVETDRRLLESDGSNQSESKLADELDEVKLKLQDREMELASVQADNAELAKQINQLLADVAKHKENDTTESTLKESLEKENNELRQKLEVVTNQKAQLETQVDDLTIASANLTKELTVAQTKLALAEGESKWVTVLFNRQDEAWDAIAKDITAIKTSLCELHSMKNLSLANTILSSIAAVK